MDIGIAAGKRHEAFLEAIEVLGLDTHPTMISRHMDVLVAYALRELAHRVVELEAEVNALKTPE